ncbi:helix-turn-helix transcriptional regulator [Methylobacterium tardum]|uniref:Transcriptional regulator n=1 Tax=Methylobacterium tardum TaxID=374432 RepID=A0AA37THA4_9HYPH|nr:helix-turn-helix transcriptional regulator [Methylobacterium tardum]URD38098.1 helix-turn-helix domain-containing protein [Methylobacterium tardum]GLS71670.1 transcriptional regulator [Methylobacterium tardum]
MEKELIRAGRALLGWSQEDLAQHSGVSRQIIARFENGSRQPHSANLQQLVSALRAAGVTEVRRKDGSAGVIASAEALQAARNAGGGSA